MLYKPLPTDTSIRILRLERSTDARFNFHVSLINLDDDHVPPYTCLSYTWGSPYPPSHPSSALYNAASDPNASELIITVDREEMQVTRSLYEALHYLHRTQAKHLEAIWIDAICIDQRDPEGLTERANQVAMMDRVYATAKHVLVWLGPCDEEVSSVVVSALRDLASVDVNTLEIARMNGELDILQPETYKKLQIPNISYNSWIHIRSVFERAWFSRMWVTQEAALAQSLTFHLGAHIISWRDLERATTLIYRLGRFFADPWIGPHGVVERILDPDPRLQRTDLTTLAWTSIVGIRGLREEWNLFPSGSNRFSARSQSMEICGPIRVTRDFLGNPQAWRGFRMYVQHKCRRKKALDPRDKIYALLGLLQGMSDETGNRVITPDYSASNEPRIMYTEITRKHLSETEREPGIWRTADLMMIPPVEDRSLRNITHLPSWVPDYSAPEWPLRLMAAAIFHFTASAHLVGGRFDTGDMFKLGVYGVAIDTIAAVGESSEEVKESASVHGMLNLLSKLHESGSMDGGGKGALLARTLVASLSLGFQTSEEDTQAAFRSYLAVLKATALHRAGYPTRTSSEHIEEELENDLAGSGHLSEFEILEQPWRPTPALILPILHFLNANANANAAPKSPSPPSSYRERAKHILSKASSYESLLSRIFSYRRIFLTAGNRLGIGPSSLRVGDEVFLVPPERTFHVLRCVARGRDEYEVMGDCYLDG
ncbi:heterokaryon incompatibility protein-domain-containing protein, partial [Aspergillus carlsbadensis]